MYEVRWENFEYYYSVCRHFELQAAGYKHFFMLFSIFAEIFKMTWVEVTALILSGLLVGFINTLAGGGTIISLSLLMFMGLPANVANGTNRIAVVAQNLVAVRSFKQQKLLDVHKGFALAIPTVIGSVLGAFIAVDLNEMIIEKSIAVVMIFMLLFILYKPQKWLKGHRELMAKPVSTWMMILFFFIGIYGGFIHVGVGYFLLAGTVLGAGFDLIRANAVKNLIVLAYAPFTLIIFMWQGQVNYNYGLVHSIGNILGAYLATKFAVNWGTNFVRWVIIIVIFVTTVQIFGLIDFRSVFTILNK